MTASTEKEAEKERFRRMEDCLARLDEGVKQLLANNYKYGMASGRGEDNGADELDGEHLPPLVITPESEPARMRRLLNEERAQRVAAMRVASEMFGNFNRLLAESVAQQAATQAALDEANRDIDALRARPVGGVLRWREKRFMGDTDARMYVDGDEWVDGEEEE